MAEMGSLATAGELVLPAVGAYQEGMAQAKAADYNAGVAENNANLSTAEAAENERKQRIIGRKALGNMRANYGASGVTMEGSPLQAMEESAANSELDSLNIRHEGESKAWAYRQDAAMSRFQAGQARTAAKINSASQFFKSYNNLSDRMSKSFTGGGK